MANALPVGYAPYLAQAVGRAPVENAEGMASHLLNQAVTSAREVGGNLSPEELYEAIQAASSALASKQPQTIADAVTMIAEELEVDVPKLWQMVLDHLGGPALAEAPAVALNKLAARAGHSYVFQVLTNGQPAAIASEDQELRVAYLQQQGTGSPAQLGLVAITTNFPVEAVAAMSELGPSFMEGLAKANPYILPELAAEAARALSRTPTATARDSVAEPPTEPSPFSDEVMVASTPGTNGSNSSIAV